VSGVPQATPASQERRRSFPLVGMLGGTAAELSPSVASGSAGTGSHAATAQKQRRSHGAPIPGTELREVMTDSNVDPYYVGTEVAQPVTTGRSASTRPGHPASR